MLFAVSLSYVFNNNAKIRQIFYIHKMFSNCKDVKLPLCDIACRFLISTVRGGAVFRVGGSMPSNSIGRCLMPFDRISPMGCGWTPITGNASRWASGTLLFTSETSCRLSVFRDAITCKEFYDRSVTHRWNSIPRVETLPTPFLYIVRDSPFGNDIDYYLVIRNSLNQK